MTVEETKLAYKISLKGMIINLFLFFFKGVCGLLINSVSLISDAVHSLTDIFSTVIVMFGISVSNKPADKKHPYGHDKIESVIAFLLGIMLFLISIFIFAEGTNKILSPKESDGQSLLINIFAVSSAVASIFAKEIMYRFTIGCANKINSPSMRADAWHHRADALSSVGSLAGVLGIYFGYPLIDAVACFAISAFIIKASFDICKESFSKIIDSSADENTIKSIKEYITSIPEVLSVDDIKTRQFGSKLYVDIEVTLDCHMSFEEAHSVAHLIHDDVENNISQIKHCTVHFSPSV